LWVIEATDIVKKELPFSEVGLNVIFVDDLTPYRIRKVMILNGAHTAMVAYGYLNGCRTVKECLEKEPVARFVREIIFEEIIPTLDLPNAELTTFADDVLERFQNPYIRHELLSIALNSIPKFRVRVLPSIFKYYTLKNKLPENLIKAFAALIVFYRGTYGGKEIILKDDAYNIKFMEDTWEYGDFKELVSDILSNKKLWNQDLTKILGLQKQLIINIILLLEREYN
ncbi:MAG: tagaturonate reductase, partial [Maribacter sp.]